ncbi:unnamed protein product, partial [Sphacelaria rigidula]
APSSAGRRRCKQEYFGDVGVNKLALDRDLCTVRPATAPGLSRSRQEPQHQQCTGWNPDIPLPRPVIPPPPARGIRAVSDYITDAGTGTVVALGPTTDLPRDGGGKRKITSASLPSGRRCASSSSVGRRRPSSRLSRSKKEEVRLLEKLNELSGPHHRGEYPTICALKRAVAIEVVQAQLREQRG